MQFRIIGFIISIIALILALLWFGWKFTLVVWLAAWGNNLTMYAKLKSPAPTDKFGEEE